MEIFACTACMIFAPKVPAEINLRQSKRLNSKIYGPIKIVNQVSEKLRLRMKMGHTVVFRFEIDIKHREMRICADSLFSTPGLD